MATLPPDRTSAGDEPWPWLVVLASVGEDDTDRMRGLGSVLRPIVVATAPHVAERATLVLRPGGGLLARTRAPQTEAVSMSLLWLDTALAREPAPEWAAPAIGARCTIATVDDHGPDVTLIGGSIAATNPDGSFRVELDGRLSEYRTAGGSPVVADGRIVGIVGPLATSTSVDAAAIESLSPPEEPDPGPPLGDDAAFVLSLAAGMVDGGPQSAQDVSTALLLASLNDALATGIVGADELRGLLAREPDADPYDLLALAGRASGLPHDVRDAERRPPFATPSPWLATVTERATRYAQATGAQQVHMRHVLASAIAADAVAPAPAALEVLGLTLPELRALTLRAVYETVPSEFHEAWDAILREPEAAPGFDLAGGIASDRVDPNTGIPLAHDYLGVGSYAVMLAAVIADRDTPMPLSIGLFGEWGSGKSTFMGLMREQVERFSRSGADGYLTSIRQIGFNAWHYADTNLWASLGQEIFEQLAGPENPEAGQREALKTELAGKLRASEDLAEATARAEQEAARLSGEIDAAAAASATSARVLVRAAAGSLDAAWKRLGVRDEAEQARLLAAELRGSAGEADELRATAGRLGGRAVLALVAVAAVAGLATVAVQRWVGGGLLAASGALGLAHLAARRVRRGLQTLHAVALDMKHNVDEQARAAIAPKIDAWRQAEASRSVLQAQLDEVVGRVGELGRELAELSPGRRLYRFVSERARGEAYTRHLGLISTVRKDFQQLVLLMAEWRERAKTDEDAPLPIDRIVLYIDDLDRCSPTQVVEVLQAVHLLLALDLFVVVVGVDPRWLLRSLQSQYDELLTPTAEEDDVSGWHASPQDYLQKIFNIPFALPRMSTTSFEQLLVGLTSDTTGAAGAPPAGPDAGAPPSRDASTESAVEPAQASEAPPVDGTPDAVAAGEIPAEEGSLVAAVAEGRIPLERRPLDGDERRMLAALKPLVETPREAKRLVNLYRIIRSSRDLSTASGFLGGDGEPGEYQAVAILLGLLGEQTGLLESLLVAAPGDTESGGLGGLRHRAPATTWAQFVAGLKPDTDGGPARNDVVGVIEDAGHVAAWRALHARLEPAAALVTLADLEPFQRWAPRVARFSFLLSAYADEPA